MPRQARLGAPGSLHHVIHKLVEEFGLSLAETVRQMGVSSSAVAKALDRRNIEAN